MNKTEKLVVHFDKVAAWTALKTIPIIIILLAIGLFIFLQTDFASSPDRSFIIFLIEGGIKLFFYLAIGVLSFSVLYYCFFLSFKVPAAILDQNGIWVKNYNFIPWSNVEVFAPYIMFGDSEVVGIRVKDVQDLSKKASFNGKLSILWSKISGYPHIMLSNLAVENKDVITFAHRYLKQ